MSSVNLIQLTPAAQQSLKLKTAEVRLHPTSSSNRFFVSNYSLEAIRRHKIPYRNLKSYRDSEIPIHVVYPYQAYLFDMPNEDAIHEVLAMGMAKFPERKSVQALYWGRFQNPARETFVLDRPGGKRSYHWSFSLRAKKIPDMRSKFPKLIKKISDPNTKVILSFGAGGIRFFAHPSLMKFIETMELKPFVQEIWGSSGGAIAGLLYSMGVAPITIEQEGYDLYNERYSFRFSPSKFEVLRNLLTDGFFQSTDHLLKGFVDCQNAMRTMLQKYLKHRKRPIPFYCIAYNLRERRNEVLTPEKVQKNIYTTPTYHTDALDAVIASSSIPILYVPKKILRGRTEHMYVDGGTTEEVPLLTPYRKWIRDRLNNLDKHKKLLILAVNLFPQVGSSMFFSHWVFRKIPILRLLKLSVTYADLIRQARIDEHKGHLLRDKNVTLVELTLPIRGAHVLNTKMIPKIIETAQHSFLNQLLAIEAKL